MVPSFEELCASLSLTEIIRLRDMLSRALLQRFERPMAVAFSDVVGSTPYFTRFGDDAGRTLQLRHIDLVNQAIAPHEGRIVDTAGDGAFLAFPSADAAGLALIELQKSVFTDNQPRPVDHRLSLRIGIHYGSVLTDGTLVSGDVVNFCARVAASAHAAEIRISKDAFLALTRADLRVQSSLLPLTNLKGVAKPAELFALHWRDRAVFPTSVLLETGEEYPIPEKDVISFGRLREQNGVPANDIVLWCGDPLTTQQISRWHFELVRLLDGFVLRPTSSALTVVDGQLVKKGEEARVKPGSQVRVADVLTLTFVSIDQQQEVDTNSTLFTPRAAS